MGVHLVDYRNDCSFVLEEFWCPALALPCSPVTFCHSLKGINSTAKTGARRTGLYFNSPEKECAIARETYRPRPFVTEVAIVVRSMFADDAHY